MSLQFVFQDVALTEFGVGRDEKGGQVFVIVPVDAKVQHELCNMGQATWNAMQCVSDEPGEYEPSEKYASRENLLLPVSNSLASTIYQLHQAGTLDIDSAALSDPDKVFCYFARFKDSNGKKLTAIRRAQYFKGILKNKNRLVRVLDDTLQLLEETVFKLDHDFDCLVDQDNVHILRPSGFESVGQLQSAILKAVPHNVALLEQELPFVDFGSISDYASKHPRAARYIASIRSGSKTAGVDMALLKGQCDHTSVAVSANDGKLYVESGNELGFLEVLDRRRYDVTLIPGTHEKYRASSRTNLAG